MVARGCAARDSEHGRHRRDRNPVRELELREDADDSLQSYPRSGLLANNLNLDLGELLERVRPGHDRVYYYVVKTVKYRNGGFVQEGSAPNFQGGLVTLATCKRRMRAGKVAAFWKGIWIAGYTGIGEVGDGRNYLAYLMRVSHVFDSQRDLWLWLPEDARRAKAAEAHRLGDAFQPCDLDADPYDPEGYASPHPCHSHLEGDEWHEDIDCTRYFGRRPPLLVGDPEYSFLWNEPRIAAPFQIPRTAKGYLDELLRSPSEGRAS